MVQALYGSTGVSSTASGVDLPGSGSERNQTKSTQIGIKIGIFNFAGVFGPKYHPGLATVLPQSCFTL